MGESPPRVLLTGATGYVGGRRGRPHPDRLKVGDTLDCWRVEAIEPDRLLRLQAEMKLPGRAWLEFVVEGDAHQATIRQTAIFDPLGLTGLVYWYGIYPLHQLVFAGMLSGIAAAGKPHSPSCPRPILRSQAKWARCRPFRR